jgi:hypothetical protein
MSESCYTAVIVDGPLVGRDTRIPIGFWSPQLCAKRADGVWLHHLRDGDVYRYAGTCAEVGHEVADVCHWSWRGQESGSHNCAEIGEHEEHRCCCGAVAT